MEHEIELNGGTAKVVADLTKSLVSHKVVTFSHPTDPVIAPAVILPNENGGLRIDPVDRLFEAYRENPKYRKGTATLNDVASFIAHVNRFKNPETALFSNNSPAAPGIAAVYDYHARVNRAIDADFAEVGEDPRIITEHHADALPNWMQHRAGYQFPLDRAWKAWQANNGSWMSQEEFALFIEERNEDILSRLPELKNPDNDADRNLAELVEDMNAVMANRRTMMGLSVGLSITATSKVVNVTGINNGTGSIVFAEENQTTDAEGRKIDVPTMFLLAVPVFDKGAPYRVIARLRYKRQGGTIQWKYDLYRDDKAFDHALTDVCQDIVTATGLPLFVGSPERC